MIWDIAVAVGFWEIWKEHNNRIFNMTVKSPEQTYHACSSFISDWSILVPGRARERVQWRLDQLPMDGDIDHFPEDSDGGGHGSDPVPHGV